MDVYQWPDGVGTRFFGMNGKPKENVKLTEFLSGRTVGIRNNTKQIMTWTLSLRLTMRELEIFWSWFNDTLGQTAGGFLCPALGPNVYRFTGIPDPQDTDQTARTLKMDIEEVF